MKIAHISDLHLNTLFTDSNLRKIKKLLSYINLQNPDHLVITGDLTDNADESDLRIIRKLLFKNDFLEGRKCSIIPGNHDIYGGPQKAEDLFTFPDRCRKTDYHETVSLFNNSLSELFDGCVYKSEKNFYPYAKLFGETLIIGLNSNAEYSRFRNPFASNGEISLNQFNEIAAILKKYRSSVDKVIVLIHHHFHKLKSRSSSIAGLWQNIEKQTMKLRNKKRLFILFNHYKVDIVLHGHIHRSDDYYRKGIRFLNGGASVKGLNDKAERVNFIYINNKSIETELHILNKDGSVSIEKFKVKEYYEVTPEGVIETQQEPVAGVI
jgi:3',5'-cyclic AMP phosphodiesterase CpdA